MSWEIAVPVYFGLLLVGCVVWHCMVQAGKHEKRQIERFAENMVPSCFGSFPGPQHQAENGCATCRLQSICLIPRPEVTSERTDNAPSV